MMGQDVEFNDFQKNQGLPLFKRSLPQKTPFPTGLVELSESAATKPESAELIVMMMMESRTILKMKYINEMGRFDNWGRKIMKL